MIRRAAALFLIASAAVPLAAQQAADPSKPAAEQPSALSAALAAPTRTPANVARDKYRHPAETLSFFGVQPSHSVVEMWPGGGWYTEVLAPRLGRDAPSRPSSGRYDERIRAKVASDPVYGKVQVATFNAGQPTAIAGSADVVLTFRNVHSWLDEKDPIADAVFAEAFRGAEAGRNARGGRASPSRRGRRREAADQRLRQGIDRSAAGREGVPIRRIERG